MVLQYAQLINDLATQHQMPSTACEKIISGFLQKLHEYSMMHGGVVVEGSPVPFSTLSSPLNSVH